MKTFRLRPKEGFAHRLGHPWVFSNQLAHSPKDCQPGELIELFDEKGRFVSRGYGHPNTLIAYRELSRDESETDLVSTDFFQRRFARAWDERLKLGLGNSSFRLIFAEGDYLPGLIVDRFYLRQDEQLFVVQTSTAGMENALPQIYEALKSLGGSNCTIINAPNSSRRQLEGLKVSPREVVFGKNTDWSHASFTILAGDFPINLKADFMNGQKTGFFLDQRTNVARTLQLLETDWKTSRPQKPIRILDLCTYVGQWATSLASLAKRFEIETEITVLDVSEDALTRATENVKQFTNQVVAIKADALGDLHELENKKFDIVICDPPALIKKRKDVPQGIAAYQKLNRSALQHIVSGGLYVSCSCSHLLSEEDFRSLLVAASRKANHKVQWLTNGAQAADHPIRFEFPEGQYLKCWIGRTK